MREILFRAKSCVGSWVYGYLKKQMVREKADVWAIQTEIPESEKPMLILPTSKQNAYTTRLYENVVDPATVGQFTGLLDCNGTKIFEGDIVRGRNEYEISDVVCRDGVFMLSMFNGHRPALWEIEPIEVIGNIHDSHELMEVISI